MVCTEHSNNERQEVSRSHSTKEKPWEGLNNYKSVAVAERLFVKQKFDDVVMLDTVARKVGEIA